MNTRWPAQADIEETRVAAASVAMTYREFRRAVLTECAKKGTARWAHEYGTPTFRTLRQRIHAFRHHLIYYAETWIRQGTYPAAHIYRALRLDRRITLEYSRKDRWRRALMRWLSPHTTLRLALGWLRMARTYEGRAFIFDTWVPRPFLARRIHYSQAIDFAVMRWGGFGSIATMDAFGSLPMEWVEAARDLGLNDPDSMIDWIPRPSPKETGKLMRFLVRKGVIVAPAEKAWLTRWYREPSYGREQELDEARLDQVVGILLQHGVARDQVVKTLCTVPDRWLDPSVILATLTLLRSRGATQYEVLLDGLKYVLFDAKPERWSFVLDTLGVRDPTTIVQFSPLLQTSKPYSVNLASALSAQGATVAHFTRCQDLLLAAGAAATGHDPGAALALLMSPPCNLSLDQVPDASEYICRSGDLATFLQSLASHGFQDAATVLRFQPFYGDVHVRTLSRLIALAKPMASTDVVGEVVDWIARCGNSSHTDSYEYLGRTLRIRTVPQLSQVAKVGFLGVGMLRYLVEERGLSSKNTLMAWFYERAFGIRSIQYWGTELDPIGKVLFQDAFDRRAFNYWESNWHCIWHAVQDRVVARLGRSPYRASEEERQQYNNVYEVACEAERAALLPVLPRMLDATSGILLASVVARAWDGLEALDHQLAELAPLLDNLFAGHGPQAASLTEIEADAIALIYRSTPYTVKHLWNAVVSREQDIHDWNLAPGYPMKWRQASWTLQMPLDKAGFEIVGRAVRWADAFNSRWSSASDSTLTALVPVDAELEHELAGLVPQLGILLAIVGEDPGAAAWLQSVPTLLTVDDERGYQHVLNMHAFFGIGLADALQERLERFCQAQPSQAARLLVRHFGDDPDKPDEPQAVLCALLKQVAQLVHDQFGRWASSELAKFGSDDAEGGTATLNAVVTKHPAAFFAKEGVKLCTAGNVVMWQEARHAHLVVFDPVHKSFQGMALLYREILPALHPSRPVLVIRAINATGDAMAAYHVSSIVDAFLSTAAEIARASGCIAVAFPPNTGMHLLSNLDPIAKDIEKRYMGAIQVLQSQMPCGVKDMWLQPAIQVATTFDAYERNVQTIGRLYLVWCNTA